MLPIADQPSASAVGRLTREYALRHELDAAWAIGPLDLLRRDGRVLLVLDDPGGEPLETLLEAPLAIDAFLSLAIDTAAALSHVHARGLVHKDIKPANIFVNCADQTVRLSGFGLASRVPRERRDPEPLEFIAGTLAYMAPEQTGRINRSVDSRADLYALGVTFYRMLTGVLPFSATEPIEWVHCHIAREPVPPVDRRPEVPAALSDIVMKLLAKTAEHRYQTAAGLKHDLRRCFAQWEKRARITRFALGQHDVPERLSIPEKLYGREREVAALRAAFDRVVAGEGPELVLVTGQGGIGKSAVVAELHRALVPARALFASGKFDQLRRDVPYASVAQALQELLGPLLAKSEAELAPWRAALGTALGRNAALMAALVPDLELILGAQPPPPELPPKDAQRRFHQLLRRLLAVFARPEHPLAMFLDDLQWLDAGTLDLLAELLADPALDHLLVVGAYRDDEVAPEHPLTQRLAAIRAAGRPVRQIDLRPLEAEQVRQMLAESLDSARVAGLARLVHEKTAGNPFFTMQFVSALADEGLVTFDRGAAAWTWQLEQIRGRDYTDNVVDLLLGKLRLLPEATRAALQCLACLGNRAPAATLAVAQGEPIESVHASLWPAVRTGLLLRQAHVYRFLHDRVQEAAYTSIPNGAQAALHLAIGRRLAQQTAGSDTDGVFDIVGQLNRAAPLIEASDERAQLAELNLAAGRRAKASAAYASALRYFTAGTDLLCRRQRRRRRPLAFALELHRAECEFLTHALAEASARLAGLARRAQSPSELAAVTRLRVDLFMTLGSSDRAVQVGLECLRRLGIEVAARPTRKQLEREYAQLWGRLGKRPVEALIDLPPMADPAAVAAVDVLTALVTPALFTDEKLRCLIIGRMGNLTIAHGNSDAACYVYTSVGNVLSLSFGDYAAGFRFAQLGLDLAARPGMERLRARVYLAFSNLAKPSPRHFPRGGPIARHVFEVAHETGDLAYAVISGNNLVTQLLAAGTPLAEVEREAETRRVAARDAGFGLIETLIATQLRLVRTLRGLTSSFGSFDEEGFDEAQFEAHLDSTPGLGIAALTYWIRKLQARFLAGDYVRALAAADRAQHLLWLSPAILERADYHFHTALAACASCRIEVARERTRCRRSVAVHERQLAAWAAHCPENFAARAALLAAEIARLEGRALDAERLFEQAVGAARSSGLVHDEALACERTAHFYAARGFTDIADLYRAKARASYGRWGAEGKVRQLDDQHPRLAAQEDTAGPTSTIDATGIEQLDLATVTRVSQEVAGQINLEKLVETLLRMSIEQAGAERGLLVFIERGEPRVKASGRTVSQSIRVERCDAPAAAATLPLSVLHHVLRTSDTVVLDDAVVQPPFSADPYVGAHRVRSVLCAPLVNRTSTTGVLYLENNLSPRVFSPRHIALLKLVAAQAAITLENALLYRDLEQREAKIRRLVDANIIGIFTWGIDQADAPPGSMCLLEVNDSFLQMLGYDREDFVTGRMPRFGLTAPEWSETDRRALAELRARGACQPFEKEYLRSDGGRVRVLIGITGFDQARSEGVGFVLDLTEQKRAEQALRRSEAYLAEAQRLTSSGAFAFDATRSLFWSEELYRIWGFDPADGIPSREMWWTRLHPDDREKTRAALDDALRDKRDYSIEYRLVLPGGIIRHVRSIGHPSYTAAGELIEVVGTTIDITERRRADAERERLRQLEADLAHLNRVGMMGELAASLAHEILHPIAAARNNARAGTRFLERNPPDLGEVMDALASVVKDVDRARDIVDRVREHVRKSPPRSELFDLNDAISEVIVMVRRAIDRHGVAVRTHLEDGLVQVRGDRVQLQQVVVNLVLNALEAMGALTEGPRELSITTEANGSTGVLVAIRDSGPGIPAEQLELVFKPFHTTKASGMGMGLSICRSIVAAHGGRLWAEANQPRGAAFRFTLPVGEENVSSPAGDRFTGQGRGILGERS
ncbi:MAG: AAA family ATPase [Alphaproteobacteria bacterium]|nr:AAA family ATPase [Alphaproteobacteria bacterium]